jgi:type IV secretory pathway VirB10-like protein
MLVTLPRLVCLRAALAGASALVACLGVPQAATAQNAAVASQQPAPSGTSAVQPVAAKLLSPASAAQAPPAQAIAGAATDPVIDASSRLHAPALIVDIADPATAPAPAGPASAAVQPAGRTGGVADDKSASPEDRFAARVSGTVTETSRAVRLTDTALVAPQGTVIPAILDTAINSDLPGFVRAVVARDVKGFDGSTVLIPRGSRLIGQYRSGVAAGQSRAFVVWSRVLTPDGVSVDIGSPGADRLGRGGLEGETNTHFFQRFGASIMLSVLSAGLEAAAGSVGNANSNTAIVIGSPQQASNIAAIALQKRIDIADTITVAQGAPIRVFVARDLDFTGVLKTRAP